MTDAKPSILSPYFEIVDFGYASRFGFTDHGPNRLTMTVIFGRDVPAAQAVAELRDLANRVEFKWCPEAIARPPAALVSAMSAEYGQ